MAGLAFVNSTVLLDGRALTVAEAAVDLSGGVCAAASDAVASQLAVWPALLSGAAVQRLLSSVRSHEFDVRPDSVDKQPAHERYIQRDGTTLPGAAGLAELTRPSVEEVTRLVNRQYPELCGGRCVACTSLVRRYRPGERRGHHEHIDGHAAVSVIVALSSAGGDYDGAGIFVSDLRRRTPVPLARGDALMHTSELWHGVAVEAGERWSWVLWFRTCPACSLAGAAEWHRRRAEAGEPLAMFAHARRAARGPAGSVGGGAAASGAGWLGLAWLGGAASLGLAWLGLAASGGAAGGAAQARVAADWFEAAAARGFAPAMHQLGLAYRHGEGRPANPRRAARWLRRAIDCLRGGSGGGGRGGAGGGSGDEGGSGAEGCGGVSGAGGEREGGEGSRGGGEDGGGGGANGGGGGARRLGGPGVAARASFDLASLLLQSAELGWPSPLAGPPEGGADGAEGGSGVAEETCGEAGATPPPPPGSASDAAVAVRLLRDAAGEGHERAAELLAAVCAGAEPWDELHADVGDAC